MSSDGDMLGDLLAEHASLERELADPAVHTDQSRARRLGRCMRSEPARRGRRERPQAIHHCADLRRFQRVIAEIRKTLLPAQAISSDCH